MIAINKITVSLGVTADGYEISNFVDNQIDRRVTAFINYFNGSQIVHQADLILWEGDDYDNAGDYTQSDLETKLTQLIK
jgi:hypothetical protein